MLLDEGVLQDESLLLRFRYDERHLVHPPEEIGNHGPPVGLPGVGTDAGPQVHRLPHVQDTALGILHEVDARRRRGLFPGLL